MAKLTEDGDDEGGYGTYSPNGEVVPQPTDDDNDPEPVCTMYSFNPADLTLIAAAPDLLATLSMGVTLRAAQRAFFKNRTQENLVASKQLEAAFDKAAHDAIAKATGAMTQGGLNL